jgi:hypothetical protein
MAKEDGGSEEQDVNQKKHENSKIRHDVSFSNSSVLIFFLATYASASC